LIDSVIRLSKVIKDYGRKKRIGPVDIEVEKGRVTGFLGPNGSGKTTCIRMMLGLIHPTSGEVRINGLDPISKHIEALKGVAYSPELPNIQTFLTPDELLALVCRELRIPRSEMKKEIEKALELVGLSEYQYTKVGKLSKGMVQRLSIAQAMVGSPRVLILDEPMIGLDPAGSSHFRRVFKKFVNENGGTVFLSSHMMTEVETLCTKVMMIHNGKILLDGTIDDVVGKVLKSSLVIVEAKGLDDVSLQKVSRLEGVIKASFNNGFLEIVTKNGSDIRPELSQLVVDSGAKLYTIKKADHLLERAYIEALGFNAEDVKQQV
jgi:ABC-2 type transport system ATP-binding protein